MSELTADVLAFLMEYRELCERYGLMIGACGCCDSPWVKKLTPEDAEGDQFNVSHWKHLEEDASTGLRPF